MSLQKISRGLSKTVESMEFGPPVTHVYNPLRYARPVHEAYLKRFGGPGKEVLFLGMNPGPWGMAQTGVPFGDVAMVRDWMQIDGAVAKPKHEHPKRSVEGLECRRSEVSGTRFWGWARDRFDSPQVFFQRFFVWNYCPLSFMTESGANYTPDKLPAVEREPLFMQCDLALREVTNWLKPEHVIGIGKFAERRARNALGKSDATIAGVLHPSPASPAANRGWSNQFENQLAGIGVRI